MAEKITYSFGIGLWKSLKNVAIVIGIPGLIFLIDNWVKWIPEKYNLIALPVFGFLSYLIKNYIQYK